jgi:hypothetical protein
MSRRLLALFLTATLFLISGCQYNGATNEYDQTGQNGTNLEDKETTTERNEETVEENVSYKILEANELIEKSKHAYQYYKSLQTNDIRDWKVFNENDSEIMIISLGLKSTGGYRIELVSAKNHFDKTVIELVEHPPAEGAIVTQALTNPTIIIQFNKGDVLENKEVILDGEVFIRHGVEHY